MKVFIAGPRALKSIDDKVIMKLNNLISKNFEIIVGDAAGIDSAVQSYFAKQGYKNVMVYATEGKYRNNIGSWEIKNVQVAKGTKGFQYYAAKDLEMAEDADCGFMIWNGESKGTLNNILNLLYMDKKIMVYYQPQQEFYAIKTYKDLQNLISICEQKTKNLFEKLINETRKSKRDIDTSSFQIALNIF